VPIHDSLSPLWERDRVRGIIRIAGMKSGAEILKGQN
jgi:hypothetical protein